MLPSRPSARRVGRVRVTISGTHGDSITIIMLKNGGHAYNRGGSHADLRLPKRRLHLLRRMIGDNGPMMLILIGKHPLSIG